MAHIINKSDLARSETSYEFEGHHYADTRVSFISLTRTTTKPSELRFRARVLNQDGAEGLELTRV